MDEEFDLGWFSWRGLRDLAGWMGEWIDLLVEIFMVRTEWNGWGEMVI